MNVSTATHWRHLLRRYESSPLNGETPDMSLGKSPVDANTYEWICTHLKVALAHAHIGADGALMSRWRPQATIQLWSILFMQVMHPLIAKKHPTANGNVFWRVDKTTHKKAFSLSPKAPSGHLLRRPIVYLEVFKSALLMNIAGDMPKLSHTFLIHLTIGALSTHHRSPWRPQVLLPWRFSK